MLVSPTPNIAIDAGDRNAHRRPVLCHTVELHVRPCRSGDADLGQHVLRSEGVEKHTLEELGG